MSGVLIAIVVIVIAVYLVRVRGIGVYRDDDE